MGEHLILMHELNIMFVLFGILVMHVKNNFFVTKVAFLHEIAHFISLPLVIGCTKCMGFKMLTKIE